MTPIHPRFDDPPLFEQAMTVMFDSIPQFSVGDFGLFWKQIQDEFDICESHPVIDPRVEAFDRPSNFAFQVQLVPAESLPRCFYRHNDRSELIQLQADRFGFNWLKRGDGKYPHSEATAARFFDLYTRFLAFCEERGFASPTVRQCEITNVNIVPTSAAGEVGEARGIFASIPAFEGPEFLTLEVASYSLQHRILGEAGEPLGRLYQTFSPALRTDTMEQAYRLELTARGAPLGLGITGIESFFAIARSSINGAFLAATTPKAHKLWGYSDGNRI